MIRKQVTMKDVALALDTSVVTVSKALAGKEGVSDAFRETIIQTAKEMGYVMKSSSKKEHTANSIIAIIIAERFISETSFYFRIYKQLLAALADREYVGLLEVISLEDEQNGVLPNAVRMESVDQVIILGEMANVFLDSIVNIDISVVFFDFESEEYDIDSIVSDNINGGFLLTRFLVKQGYEKIGFVGSYTSTRSILDRYMGYRKYLIAKNRDFNQSWVIDDRGEDGRYIDMKLPDKDKMPEAFVCNCDEVAWRMIELLQNSGYKVPEDIAVVGYDDFFELDAVSDMGLTTYRVNIEEMVRCCAHIIDQRSHNKEYHRGTTVVHGELVVRDSVKLK